MMALAEDELSKIKGMIKERFQQNQSTYSDGCVAADISLEGVCPGKFISANVVKHIREMMGIQITSRLPTKKIADRQPVASSELPQPEIKSERIGENVNRLSPAEIVVLTKFFNDNPEMTGKQLRDTINSKGMSQKPVKLSWVNYFRAKIKKNGSTATPEKRGKARKSAKENPQPRKKAAATPAEDSGSVGESIQNAIDDLKDKRAAIDNAIEQLETIKASFAA